MDMAMSLSAGALKWIMDGHPIVQPIVQVSWKTQKFRRGATKYKNHEMI